MHLIEVRDVYKIYNPGENQVNALDGVSITIDEGEFVAIIGQSGSGKSTLMNMLGLLDTPTHGEYYINGKLVDDLTDDHMSVIRNEEIGFIFQGFNLISLSWVITITVLPSSLSSCKIAITSFVDFVSRLPVGSSAKITGGFAAIALATARWLRIILTPVMRKNTAESQRKIIKTRLTRVDT